MNSREIKNHLEELELRLSCIDTNDLDYRIKLMQDIKDFETIEWTKENETNNDWTK
jgi:hypothetical protein